MGWGRSPSYLLRCLYSQLIRFASVSGRMSEYNARDKILTAKLLHQGSRSHKLRKNIFKILSPTLSLVSKGKVGLKSLLLQGLSEPEFYDDFVYK